MAHTSPRAEACSCLTVSRTVGISAGKGPRLLLGLRWLGDGEGAHANFRKRTELQAHQCQHLKQRPPTQPSYFPSSRSLPAQASGKHSEGAGPDPVLVCHLPLGRALGP